MKEIVIDIQKLNKTFNIPKKSITVKDKITNLFGLNHSKLHVLKDIDLEVCQGEFIGIIGKNGSGKSTLLKIILGSIEADEGSKVSTKGKIIRLALGIGFDEKLTARDNIYLNGTILGLSFNQIGKKFDDIIHFSELEKFVDTPLRYFSSGMQSRLAFSVALHAEADIFLIDEFFGDVGDEQFKEKAQTAFEQNILKGKTIIHVSHSLELIRKHCQKVFVLENGKGVLYNDPQQAIHQYIH